MSYSLLSSERMKLIREGKNPQLTAELNDINQCSVKRAVRDMRLEDIYVIARVMKFPTNRSD